HRVVTDNHLGDWGTQFGMLLYGFKHFRNEEALKADPVREMVRLYIEVQSRIAKEVIDKEIAKRLLVIGPEDAESELAEACRAETAKLHAGDAENTKLWEQFMPWCSEELDRIYR